MPDAELNRVRGFLMREQKGGCLRINPLHFLHMNALLPAVVVLAFGSLPLRAQTLPATPATPTKFDTRRIGDTVNGGGTVGFMPAKPQTVVRTVTHIVLGEPRQWKLTDGKFFVGKLIAFEDIVTEGNTATAPVVPKNPTVVRDGKARLLVDARVYEVTLQSFGPDERKFIEDTRAALAAKK
jgi:hypothetical protein